MAFEKPAVTQTRGVTTNDGIMAELARLRSENEALRAKATARLRLAVSEKGAVSLYGLRRFPVTFYAAEWATILGMADAVRSFMAEHATSLSTKRPEA